MDLRFSFHKFVYLGHIQEASECALGLKEVQYTNTLVLDTCGGLLTVQYRQYFFYAL